MMGIELDHHVLVNFNKKQKEKNSLCKIKESKEYSAMVYVPFC